MKEQAAKIQIVINTLETLNIPPTYYNVNRLTGVYNTLTKVRNELLDMKEEAKNERDADAK